MENILKVHPCGLKLRLVRVETMFANENVIKLVNTNIQLFFSFHVESRSTRRLRVWVLCDALDVEHNRRRVED